MFLKLVKLIFVNGGIVIVGVVTGIIVARALGPDGRGYLAEYYLLATITTGILSLSLSENFTIHTKLIRKESIKNLIRYTTFQWMLMMPLGLAICYLFKKLDFLFSTHNYIYLLILTWSNYLLMSFSGVFHAESKYRALVLLQIFVPTTYLVLLLLFWLYLNLSVEYAIISNTVANLIACVLAIYLYKKSYPIQDKCKLVWTFKDCFFFINKCFKIHASSVLQIIVSNIDKYLISFLFSSKDLGYYIVASTLSLALLNSLMNSFVTLLLPRFAGNRLSKEIYLEMRKALTVLFLISFLIVIAIITTSKYIIPFVYGKSFSNSIYLSQIVAVSSLFVVLKSAFIRFVRCLQIEGKDVSFYFADIISIFCLVVSAYVYDQFSTLSTVIIVVLFGISNAIGLMYLLSHYFLKGSYCK